MVQAAQAPQPQANPLLAALGPRAGAGMPGVAPVGGPRMPPPGGVPAVPVQQPEEEEQPAEMPAMGGLNPQIRERILQDPQYLQQILLQLQQTNPQLYQIIQQNPQAMLQLLLGGGAGGARRPRPGGIQVTPEEKAAIDRVII